MAKNKKHNTQNLLPAITREEARERGRAGGRASGEARREKKRFKEMIEAALECETPDGFTIKEGITATLVMKAKKGDLKAVEMVMAQIGEQPALKVEVAGDLTGAMDEMDKYMGELWTEEQKNVTSKDTGT